MNEPADSMPAEDVAARHRERIAALATALFGATVASTSAIARRGLGSDHHATGAVLVACAAVGAFALALRGAGRDRALVLRPLALLAADGATFFLARRAERARLDAYYAEAARQ